MTDLLVAWVLLPLLAVGLAAGIGLLIERIAGRRMPPELVVVVGLGGFVVLCDLATLAGEASRYTTWAVVALGAAGLVDGVVRRRRASKDDARPAGVATHHRTRPDLATWAGALVGLLLLASPFVASGGATFGAYGTLGDSAFQMLGMSFLPDIGRTTDGLDPSTVTTTLDAYFAGNGYPAGGPAALGVVSRIVGGDPFVTFAPGLVGLCGAMGLGVGLLLRPHTDRVTRGLAVVAAMQAPLLVAFTWQGSVKEVGIMAFVVVTLAAAAWVIDALRDGAGARTAVVPGVAVAGLVSMASLGSAPWLGMMALLVGVVLLVEVRAGRIPLKPVATAGAVAAVVAVVLAIPTLSTLGQFFDVAQGVLTSQVETGNLGQPLPWWQTFSPWLTEDFRRELVGTPLAFSQVLGGLVAVLGVAGVVVAARRGAWLVVAWAVTSLVACVYVVRAGSPWADAKALAITAPTIFALACVGTSALRGRRSFVALRGVLLVGVLAPLLVSTVYAYRGVALAPTDRLEELRDLSSTIGPGPVLVPEFDEFAKVALRDSTPEVLNDAHRARSVGVQPGAEISGFGTSLSVSSLVPRDVARFPFVVLRGGPEVSWPVGFRLRERTKHYVLLQRDPAERNLVATGSAVDATTSELAARTLPCPSAALRRRLTALVTDGSARERAARRRIVARTTGDASGTAPRTGLVRPPASQADAPTFKITSLWLSDSGTIQTLGPGNAQGYMEVPATGRYRVWLEGDMNRPVSVTIGGRVVGRIDRAINMTRQSEPVGEIDLRRGTAEVRIDRGGGSLRPGGSNTSQRSGAIGRMYLQSVDEPAVQRVRCGSAATVDWIAPGGTAAAVDALEVRDDQQRAAARQRRAERDADRGTRGDRSSGRSDG